MKKWLETDSFEEAFEKYNDNMEEIEQKLTEPLILENLIENGDFSNGTNGWTTQGRAVQGRVVDDYYTYTRTNATFGWSAIETSKTIHVLEDDLVYISANIFSDTDLDNQDYYWINGYSVAYRYPEFVTNEWNVISGVVRVNQSGSGRVALRKFIEVGGEARFKKIFTLNLTETFGAGNEPTKEEMDEIINIIGWFDNEYAVSNKEMFIALLNMIRKNTTAIIALGGTQ